MSFITAIDTLQFSNRMQKAGLDKKISDELAEAIKESNNQILENTTNEQDILLFEKKIECELSVIRSDIASVRSEVNLFRSELKRDIESVRSELKHDIESVRSELKLDIESVRSEVNLVRSDLKNEIKTAMLATIISLGTIMALVEKFIN